MSVIGSDFDERSAEYVANVLGAVQERFRRDAETYREMLRGAENTLEVRQRLANLALLEDRSTRWGSSIELWQNGHTTLVGMANTLTRS